MEKEKLGQEQAFADEYNTGMSKRFYAACAAIQGIMANVRAEPTEDSHFKNMAEDAYRIADELLRQENL